VSSLRCGPRHHARGFEITISFSPEQQAKVRCDLESTLESGYNPFTLSVIQGSFSMDRTLANKTLQLTPSRHASTFHDRLPTLSTLILEFNPRSG
jgi:hypothetical protein